MVVSGSLHSCSVYPSERVVTAMLQLVNLAEQDCVTLEGESKGVNGLRLNTSEVRE